MKNDEMISEALLVAVMIIVLMALGYLLLARFSIFDPLNAIIGSAVSSIGKP